MALTRRAFAAATAAGVVASHCRACQGMSGSRHGLDDDVS